MAGLGTCGLFAAISGSNSATTATIGSMLHPEMVKGGYDERISAATAAAGGTVGIIIPPSIIFIVYGFLMNLPIGDLFIAGIIPGALMVLAMMFACFVVCFKYKWGYIIDFNVYRVFKTGIGAWLGFFAIGLVLRGIYTGKFSPTEAAGVIVGFCVIVAPLIAVSVVMQQILSVMGAQAFLTEFVTSMGGYYAVLFTAVAIVFVCGMVLESLPVTIILAPILAPIADDIGVEPVQFSVIFLVGASIGFITPPYGLNLYVASGVTGVPYFRLLRYTWPYLIALLSIWIIVALVPSLSTALLPEL